MNRAMRREMKKDKNLINNLFNIINKYFPKLLFMFENLSDKRNKSYVKYSIKKICITRLIALVCGFTSMAELENKLNNEVATNKINDFCNEYSKFLPYWETIQDVFSNIDTEELRKIQKEMAYTLIRSKVCDKFRFNNSFVIAVDATGLSSHNYNLNDNCLTREHKSGLITYHKSVLECKLILGSMTISIYSEFIENQSIGTENKKQDCEVKAFKRMAKEIKKQFPKLKFTLTGDALYATEPVMSICKKYKWDYILNLKPQRLKEVNETFEGNISCQNETDEINYALSSGIDYKGHILNVIKYTNYDELNKLTPKTKKVSKQKNTLNTFRYVTNISINNAVTVNEIVKIGRSRWKIESCFYVQKNGEYNISHMCSRNDIAMKNHYLFIQFAHTIRQLLELGDVSINKLPLKLKEISELIYESLISISFKIESTKNFQLRFDY